MASLGHNEFINHRSIPLARTSLSPWIKFGTYSVISSCCQIIVNHLMFGGQCIWSACTFGLQVSYHDLKRRQVMKSNGQSDCWHVPFSLTQMLWCPVLIQSLCILIYFLWCYDIDQITLSEGNPPVTERFPTQITSNVELWWFFLS